MSVPIRCTASRRKQCVLACYNMIIPYLMPELPDAQKAALAESVKVPLVYVNVVIRNWQSFVKLGVQQIYSPTAFFSADQARLSCSARRLQQSAQPRRADGAAHGACAGRAEPGPEHGRPEPDRPPETAGNDVSRISRRRSPTSSTACWAAAASSRRATSRRSPSTAGRTAMRATSIRCSTRKPDRPTLRGGARSRRTGGDRQFRRRLERLLPRSDRPGLARRRRAQGSVVAVSFIHASDSSENRFVSASTGRAWRTRACRAHKAGRAVRRRPETASNSSRRTGRSAMSRQI